MLDSLKVKSKTKLFTATAVVAVFLFSISTWADEKKSTRVPSPVFKINTDKGDKCVEPEEIMLRDHMKFILHQRDKTMHQGIRTTKHSLKNCVDCHADNKTGSVLGKEGFCSSCHVYASVKIDCFECHSATREASATNNSTPPTSSVRALNTAKTAESSKGPRP